MTGALHLVVTTPLQIVLDIEGIASLRGEDASGDFGILPGHADFLTVIDAGVMRWRDATGPWRFCALRGGVFTVTEGREIRVACREAIPGDDLASLLPQVAEARAQAEDDARRARAHGTGLHARAIRQMMRDLSPGGDTLGLGSELER